jgi:hypothetical protein
VNRSPDFNHIMRALDGVIVWFLGFMYAQKEYRASIDLSKTSRDFSGSPKTHLHNWLAQFINIGINDLLTNRALKRHHATK